MHTVVPNHPLPHSVVPPVAPIAPDLTGRMAQCAYCGHEEPSSEKLAFFVYRGEGSTEAVEGCGKCGYRRVAHEKSGMANNVMANRLTVVERGYCDGFVARGGLVADEYYCGCRGWS